MREKAVVVRIEDAGAVLALTPADEARCGSCGACGLGGGRTELRVKDAGALRVGDTVTVDVTYPSVVVSALLVFIVPIAGAFIAWLVASVLAGTAWIKGVAAAAGLVAGFLIAGLYDRRWRARHGHGVRIIGVQPQEDDPDDVTPD